MSVVGGGTWGVCAFFSSFFRSCRFSSNNSVIRLFFGCSCSFSVAISLSLSVLIARLNAWVEGASMFWVEGTSIMSLEVLILLPSLVLGTTLMVGSSICCISAMSISMRWLGTLVCFGLLILIRGF